MENQDISQDSSGAPQKQPRKNIAEQFGDWGRDLGDRLDDYFHSSRSGRLTSSAFAIAWSLVAFVILFYFHQYIAYYEYTAVEGVSEWVRTPVLTEEYTSWLPVAGVALGLGITGHIILIIFDSSCYGTSILRQGVIMILNLFGIAAVLTLLKLFPFDFSAVPHQALSEALPIVAAIALVGIAIGLTVSTIVHFVRLVVAVAR